jgi:hypothetical protein
MAAVLGMLDCEDKGIVILRKTQNYLPNYTA